MLLNSVTIATRMEEKAKKKTPLRMVYLEEQRETSAGKEVGNFQEIDQTRKRTKKTVRMILNLKTISKSKQPKWQG